MTVKEKAIQLIDDCTCQPFTFSRFEKERYNKVLEEKCDECKVLKEVDRNLTLN